MSTEGEKRKLVDLRVVDLRAELEKRGLDNKGVKATLIERLQKVLRDEGYDADEHLFEIEPVKTPKRSSTKRGEHDTESETQSIADENHDTSMDVEEEVKEEEEEDKENGQTEQRAAGDKLDPEGPTSEPDNLVATIKVEKVEETNNEQAQDADKSIPEANGVDNEDSINLTIGEDEEKLLADEVGHEEDSSSQEKEAKDEGERAVSKAEDGSAAGEIKKPAGQQEEDKDSATQDGKTQKTQEEMNDKAGEKGKSATGNADQKLGKDDKDKRAKASAPVSSSRNLWVSGLSSSTRATDLKQVFSKYGKVIGAKVVTNARTPGARCYGYVTMATSDDASKCIQHLHRTELHGRMISVERAKGDAAGPPKKGVDGRAATAKKTEEKKRHERRPSGAKAEDKKDEPAATDSTAGDSAAGAASDCAPKEVGSPEAEVKSDAEAKGDGERRPSVEKGHASARTSRATSRDTSRERARLRSAGSSHYSQHSRPLSCSPHSRFRGASPSRRPGVLTFTQIREERERQRLRERERELREEDRRRREEMARQRVIERRQQDEAVRLEREKERLRIERERIEAERAELMRLERERQRLEREKLEREREELKRQQLRFEEARRSTKRPSDDRRDSYGEDRKRVATERRYEGSQSSRFDENTRSNEFQGKKDYKEFTTGGGRRAVGASAYEAEGRSSRGEGPKKEIELPRREAVADAGRGKDSRFERGPSFRVREERRPENDHRPKVDIRHSNRERYPDSTKGERYGERSGEWHAAGGPPPVKAFSSLGGPSGRDGWAGSERKAESGQGWGRPMESNSSDRWVSGGGGPMTVSRGPAMGPMYSGQQNVAANAQSMSMGMSGGPYGGDRFEYKQSMGPMRKY